jgi:hypothetical protein
MRLTLFHVSASFVPKGEPFGLTSQSNRKIAAKRPSVVEQNVLVAPLLQPTSKRVFACHEATKLTPRCLVDVDRDNNGELP